MPSALCFKVQTGHMTADDVLFTRLFISTLDETDFYWFNKLPAGSIKCWTDLERLFLLRFYETDTDITIHTLMDKKQEKNESSKDFVERFWQAACRVNGNIPQEDLVAICRHSLHFQIV